MGVSVGAREGLGVGLKLGSAVGEVGTIVGLAVGVVGTTVGVAVGFTVVSMLYSHAQ